MVSLVAGLYSWDVFKNDLNITDQISLKIYCHLIANAITKLLFAFRSLEGQNRLELLLFLDSRELF